jgi:hypothetical protein
MKNIIGGEEECFAALVLCHIQHQGRKCVLCATTNLVQKRQIYFGGNTKDRISFRTCNACGLQYGKFIKLQDDIKDDYHYHYNSDDTTDHSDDYHSDDHTHSPKRRRMQGDLYC